MSRHALETIVKTYDVRGLVANQLTPEVAYALGAATADVLGLSGEGFLIGHDMRPSSPELAAALAAGATSRGAEVQMVGLASTDMVYFASGRDRQAAAMVTASHNPPEYNGIKLCRAGALGISLDTGLGEIRDRAIELLEQGVVQDSLQVALPQTDVLDDYGAFLRGLVDLSGIRPLRLVVDAANGMAGYTVPAVLGQADLPIELIELYFELDGTFPNHEANPLEPENLRDLQEAVRAHDADLGLAFDGDADRCFVVDERGEPVSPSVIGAMVARREISRVRDQLGEIQPTILHNLICSKALAESIESEGAIARRTPVGHSLIKDIMASTGAVFGAEHSAHYYFRDFFGADSGMLAALHVIAELGGQEAPLSELATRDHPYVQSGEINFRVADPQAVIAALESEFGVEWSVDRLDGLSVFGPEAGPSMWWFNVRASNTEPLLRLNVEAATPDALGEITGRVRDLIVNS